MNQEELKQRLIELLNETFAEQYDKRGLLTAPHTAEALIENGVTIRERARPLEEWGEDCGAVLWWKFPIEEPPYAGSPLDATWPGYHTHWTPITLPYCGADMRGVKDEK